MYQVSNEFNEKMKALNRKVYAKVQIDYTDPFLDQSIQVEGNENANVSYPKQTADNIQEPIGKIASLDGTWVLGGDYVLAPGVDEIETHQMGWWGEQLAQEDGSFVEPYPTLTATFFSRPIHSLKVVGDSARQEWPVDFIINLYDENNNLLYTETVTGNTEIEWSKSIEPITQVTKMELVITKWSHPGRQVKILEFFTSIQEVYEGDDILLVHLLEEREVSQGSLPVGNISSNEIDIRLFNRNRKFDAGNKNSPLYETLKANRRIKAWIGTENELVPLGTFWSGDWNSPEDNIYAQTTGRDRLELLRKSTYDSSEVETGHSLEFDGVDDYVATASSSVLEIQEHAIECMINAKDYDAWRGIVEIAFGYTRTSRFMTFGNNIIRYHPAFNNSVGKYIEFTDLPTNKLIHLVGVWDGEKCIGYLNGKKVGEIDFTGEITYDSTPFVFIGKDNYRDRFFNGNIYEVRIWNKALTQEEIQANMYKKLKGDEDGLVAYYDFSEGEGTIIHDKTGNGNDGTIHGATWKNTGVSLAYLARKVLQDAELKEGEYWIDPELQQYTVPYAYFESQSHREALRKIAEACLGQVYCDREGIIRIEGPSYLEKQNETALSITQDDYFSKDNPVKWSEIANYIEVETQPLRADTEQEVYRSNEPVSISAGETKTITAYYNHTPCIDAVASIEGVGTIVDATYYAWGATVKVTSSTTGTFTLVINAKPLKVLNKEKAIAKDDASIIDNGKLRYVFPKNPLIQTREIAQKIADKLLQYYKDPRRDVSIEWRGNPALLLGDRVSVTDKNEINNYNVVKQELEYDGSLRAKLSGRKVK